jgi:hypothetical protein
MDKQISYKIIPLCLGVLAISFLLSYVVLAWTEPTMSPPGGNVAPPLRLIDTGTSLETSITNATYSEGDIKEVNIVIGNNDLHLRSDSGNQSAIYLGTAESGSKELGFYIDGSERMKIDNSGNVTMTGDLEVSGKISNTISIPNNRSILVWDNSNSIKASDLVDILNNGTGGNVVTGVAKWDNAQEKYISYAVVLGITDFDIYNGEEVQIDTTGITTVSVSGRIKRTPLFVTTPDTTGQAAIIIGDVSVSGGLNVSGGITLGGEKRTTWPSGGITACRPTGFDYDTICSIPIKDGDTPCPVWKDCDGDGYTYGTGDCDESCADCYVGSTIITNKIDGRDQDCDGKIDEKVDEITIDWFWYGMTKNCNFVKDGLYCFHGRGSLTPSCTDWCNLYVDLEFGSMTGLVGYANLCTDWGNAELRCSTWGKGCDVGVPSGYHMYRCKCGGYRYQ